MYVTKVPYVISYVEIKTCKARDNLLYITNNVLFNVKETHALKKEDLDFTHDKTLTYT